MFSDREFREKKNISKIRRLVQMWRRKLSACENLQKRQVRLGAVKIGKSSEAHSQMDRSGCSS